jgi:hypothetical protein
MRIWEVENIWISFRFFLFFFLKIWNRVAFFGFFRFGWFDPGQSSKVRVGHGFARINSWLVLVYKGRFGSDHGLTMERVWTVLNWNNQIQLMLGSNLIVIQIWGRFDHDLDWSNCGHKLVRTGLTQMSFFNLLLRRSKDVILVVEIYNGSILFQNYFQSQECMILKLFLVKCVMSNYRSIVVQILWGSVPSMLDSTTRIKVHAYKLII